MSGFPRDLSDLSIGRVASGPFSWLQEHAPHASFGVFAAIALTRLPLYLLAEYFRTPSPARALATLTRWSRWACPWLRLRIEVEGRVAAEPCLYIANHRSYLDIPVLTAALGATFLSRADIGSWPWVGRVAQLTGAVLVDRDEPHDRMRAARVLMRRLRTASVVVFPEGTTTGATLPAAFFPGLFRLVRRSSVPIVPITVRYNERRAYWIDDVSVGEHLRANVLRGGRLRVVVHVGLPLHAADFDAPEALAASTYAAVCAPIERCGELV